MIEGACLLFAVLFLIMLFCFLIINIVSIYKKRKKEQKFRMNIIFIVIILFLLSLNFGSIYWTQFNQEEPNGFTAFQAMEEVESIIKDNSSIKYLVQVRSGEGFEEGYSQNWIFEFKHQTISINYNGTYNISDYESHFPVDHEITNWTIDSDEAFRTMEDKHLRKHLLYPHDPEMVLSYNSNIKAPVWQNSYWVPYGIDYYHVNAQTGEIYDDR
ncbi:MAG: hypothetical protein KAH57_05255 [Thermoplasmata archaeon]|nr:hypothetical protein [Thermoplasmata archaeon]